VSWRFLCLFLGLKGVGLERRLPKRFFFKEVFITSGYTGLLFLMIRLFRMFASFGLSPHPKKPDLDSRVSSVLCKGEK
jgi:hypothetical protein